MRNIKKYVHKIPVKITLKRTFHAMDTDLNDINRGWQKQTKNWRQENPGSIKRG